MLIGSTFTIFILVFKGGFMTTTTKRLNNQDERKLVSKAAKKASSTAFRISTALELPIKIVQGTKIILKGADGSSKEIKEISKVKSRVSLSKGTKICLQPKG